MPKYLTISISFATIPNINKKSLQTKTIKEDKERINDYGNSNTDKK